MLVLLQQECPQSIVCICVLRIDSQGRLITCSCCIKLAFSVKENGELELSSAIAGRECDSLTEVLDCLIGSVELHQHRSQDGMRVDVIRFDFGCP